MSQRDQSLLVLWYCGYTSPNVSGPQPRIGRLAISGSVSPQVLSRVASVPELRLPIETIRATRALPKPPWAFDGRDATTPARTPNPATTSATEIKTGHR